MTRKERNREKTNRRKRRRRRKIWEIREKRKLLWHYLIKILLQTKRTLI